MSLGPLFDDHPLPHLAFDIGTLEIVAANPAAAAYYGHAVASLVGRPRTDLLDPAEHETLHRFLAGLPDGAPAPTTQPRVWLERHADGRRLHSDIRGMTHVVDGRPLRVAVVIDAASPTAIAAAARDQAELFAVAERVARVGGWRLDLDTQQLHRTPAAAAIHGDAGSTHVDDADALAPYPPAERARLCAATEAAARDGLPFDLQMAVPTPEGGTRWVRCAGEPVRDASGRIVAIHGALQDVTEFKEAEVALRASQETLQATLRALPDLWLLFDADGTYLEVSNPDHPALSAPWSEKRGRRLADTMPPDLLQHMDASLAAARRTGGLHPYSYEMVTREGERRHFEGRTVALDGGRWMTLVRDQTDTVHLEQRFRLLTESVPVAIHESDADGGCRWVNPAWQALFGLTPQQAAGDGWMQAVHPDDRAATAAAWQASVRERRPHDHENRIVRPDGSIRHVGASTLPLRRADGAVVGHVGVIVDLTQQRELDDARRAREVAEEAQRRQAAFLSRLSHELRTPLNAIIGFTELMRMDEVSPAPPGSTPAGAGTPGRLARLGYVRDAGQHMLALVDDLLELQRLQQGAVPLAHERLDLAETLDACAAMLEPMARPRRIRFEREVTPGLAVRTDRRALRQLLLNLGSNAVKYGREGGCVRLRALAATMPAGPLDTPAVCVEVTDDGDGLSAEALARLFQPFERLGRERGDQPGTGLGLVIAQQLAQVLGGTLALVSTPGRGTTARLTLPGAPG